MQNILKLLCFLSFYSHVSFHSILFSAEAFMPPFAISLFCVIYLCTSISLIVLISKGMESRLTFFWKSEAIVFPRRCLLQRLQFLMARSSTIIVTPSASSYLDLNTITFWIGQSSSRLRFELQK